MILPKTTFMIVICTIGAVGTAGCSSDASEDSGLDGWQGQSSHFMAHGRLNGEDIDISLQDTDLNTLFCEREYIIPSVGGEPQYDQGSLQEIKLNAFLSDRFVELELKKHDFQSDSVGASIPIIPRVDGVDPAPSEMWLEWEWHSLDDETMYEAAAQGGSTELMRFEGEPGSDGLVIPENEGATGAFVEARWSETEQLSISFSTPCTVNNVELVE